MKLIILDRDGVINYDSDQYIKSPDEWRAIPVSIGPAIDPAGLSAKEILMSLRILLVARLPNFGSLAVDKKVFWC
jgi:hypothetical protein